MRVALCGAWMRREELRGYADELRAQSVSVVSRWLTVEPAFPDDGASMNAPSAALAQVAQQDLEDIAAADIIVSFAEPSGSPWTRGGRHAEHGFALALLLMEDAPRLAIVGPREHLFHHAVGIYHFDRWDLCRGWILAWSGHEAPQ